MADLRELEARIKKLEEIEAIKRLKHKYFRCIDKGLWDELVVDCFAEDGVGDFGDYGIVQGRAALTEFYTEKIGPTFSMCVHQGHNPEIDLTSDTTATGMWELENFMVTANTNIGFWIAAFYEDEYVKEQGEWKISKTRIPLIFWSDIEKGWAKERFSSMPEVA